jgi:hypothetical protein
VEERSFQLFSSVRPATSVRMGQSAVLLEMHAHSRDAGTRCVSKVVFLNGYSSPVRPHDAGNTQNGREKSTMQAAEAIEKNSEALKLRSTKLGDRRADALQGLRSAMLRYVTPYTR